MGNKCSEALSKGSNNMYKMYRPWAYALVINYEHMHIHLIGNSFLLYCEVALKLKAWTRFYTMSHAFFRRMKCLLEISTMRNMKCETTNKDIRGGC